MTLRVGLPDLVSPSYFPAIAAVELGYFREQGLEAEIELVFPVTKAFEELRTGQLDIVAGSAHAMLYGADGDAGCRLLAALSQNMYWFLVVRRDLEPTRGDLNRLKGLRIAAAPGPVDGLRRMIEVAGLDPDRDLELVPVPAASSAGVSFGVAAAEALQTGAVDGFWANGMGARVALDQGVGAVVVDARRGDGPAGSIDYTFAALAAASERIEADPEHAAGAVRAIVAAQGALRHDPEIARQAAARHFPDRELELIPDLIRRDAPFYDATISRAKAAALVWFARDIGIVDRNEIPYEELVASQFERWWVTSV
jgi:ABC-type nitrate/sulfonate/bicarbonate transport system substrate-binding protein